MLRRLILTASLLLAAGMGLYPPWLETTVQVPALDDHGLHPTRSTTAWGRAPLFSPPRARYVGATLDYPAEWTTYRLDLPRLVAEWLALGFLAGMTYLLLPVADRRWGGVESNGRAR